MCRAPEEVHGKQQVVTLLGSGAVAGGPPGTGAHAVGRGCQAPSTILLQGPGQNQTERGSETCTDRETLGLGHFSCCRAAQRWLDDRLQVAPWGGNFWPQI